MLNINFIRKQSANNFSRCNSYRILVLATINPSHSIINWLCFDGLVIVSTLIFTGLIAIDTQKAIEDYDNKQLDSVKIATELLLDAVNLLIDFVKISIEIIKNKD